MSRVASTFGGVPAWPSESDIRRDKGADVLLSEDHTPRNIRPDPILKLTFPDESTAVVRFTAARLTSVVLSTSGWRSRTGLGASGRDRVATDRRVADGNRRSPRGDVDRGGTRRGGKPDRRGSLGCRRRSGGSGRSRSGRPRSGRPRSGRPRNGRPSGGPRPLLDVGDPDLEWQTLCFPAGHPVQTERGRVGGGRVGGGRVGGGRVETWVDGGVTIGRHFRIDWDDGIDPRRDQKSGLPRSGRFIGASGRLAADGRCGGMGQDGKLGRIGRPG